MKQWYEELFTDYANTYDKEEFTKGTVTEVDFIESQIEFDSTRKILDVGCGTGRHAIELAKRGYQVTGIDLSEDQLKRAKEKAESEGVEVTFLQGDARDFSFDEPYMSMPLGNLPLVGKCDGVIAVDKDPWAILAK